MFGFLKRKKDNNIYAPVSGKCIDITEVQDATFASKMMGDGIAIIPLTNVVKAPCDGEISAMFHTGHAFGVKADNGLEILIHIGIDTVNLEGKGFTVLKQKGDKIKKGEAIIEFDLENIKKDFDTSTMMIITNGEAFNKLNVSKDVEDGEVIMEAK